MDTIQEPTPATYLAEDVYAHVAWPAAIRGQIDPANQRTVGVLLKPCSNPQFSETNRTFRQGF
jgi:hypothetical protein